MSILKVDQIQDTAGKKILQNTGEFFAGEAKMIRQQPLFQHRVFVIYSTGVKVAT